MYRTILSALLLAMALAFTGCATTGSSDGSGDSSSGAPAREYYQEEFSDISIPIDMDVVSGETFVTYSPGGMKVGIQQFKGRVEIGSLVSTMQRYMQRDGWTLRAVFRANKSVLIFEKSDKICVLSMSDGMIYTTMMVFVSPKLAPGDVRYSSPAMTPSASPSSSGGVQSYPSGGFSNPGAGEQKLAQ